MGLDRRGFALAFSPTSVGNSVALPASEDTTPPLVGSRKPHLELAADCGRITGNSDVTRLGKGCRQYAQNLIFKLPRTRFARVS